MCASARPIITLLTDFGPGSYAAAMKGVILGLSPAATLVDISHSVPPQDIVHAAFLLHTVHPYFPPETIHVAVVDPGVGSARRAVLVVSPRALFLAPDNGLLSYLLGAGESPWPGFVVRERAVPTGLRAFHLTQERFWRQPVSSTFHGRDLFAPVAAHLSRGVAPEEFGPPLASLLVFPIPRPQVQPEGSLLGHIQHIDPFGNLITDIRVEHLSSTPPAIQVAGRTIPGLSPSYAEGGELLVLMGSSGYLEIAARNESAARVLAARRGDGVLVEG